GDRRLQAGHRPAELPDGRRRERDPARTGDLRLHRGPHGAPQAGGAPARAVPYEPKQQRLFGLLMLGYCVVLGLAILSIVAISQFAAVVKFFPYNLTLTWAHYDFDQKGGGG